MVFDDPILIARVASFLEAVEQRRPHLLSTRRSCLNDFGKLSSEWMAKSAVFDDLCETQWETRFPDLWQINRCVIRKSSDKWQNRRHVAALTIGSKFAEVVIAMLDQRRSTSDFKIVKTRAATVLLTNPRQPTDPTIIAFEIPHFTGIAAKGYAVFEGAKGPVKLDLLRLFGELLFEVLEASLDEAEQLALLITDLIDAFQVAQGP